MLVAVHIVVFSVLTPYSLVGDTNISDRYAASIIRVEVSGLRMQSGYAEMLQGRWSLL
jgi:hypothetical protein